MRSSREGRGIFSRMRCPQHQDGFGHLCMFDPRGAILQSEGDGASAYWRARRDAVRSRHPKATIDDVLARFAPVAGEGDLNDELGEDDDLSDDENDDGVSEDSGPDSDGSDFGDLEFEPIDLEDCEDNPPPVKRVRLLGFHTARDQGSSSSSRAASAAPKSHDLTTGERIWMLNEVLLSNNGIFRNPSPSSLTKICAKGMEQGDLSMRVSYESVYSFLRSVEQSCV